MAPATTDRIRDVNIRYHDLAAADYDAKWGIDYGEVGQGQVLGKVRKALVEPRTLLVHFLREQLLLTGTHIGCDTSQCGACTVLVDGRSAKSCTMFAVQADGSTVTTIEGLEKGGRLHPVQEAFLEVGALQCGYCTPGMIMSSVALLVKTPDPTADEISRLMEGNVCRCGTYPRIVAAIGKAAKVMKGGAK